MIRKVDAPPLYQRKKDAGLEKRVWRAPKACLLIKMQVNSTANEFAGEGLTSKASPSQMVIPHIQM